MAVVARTAPAAAVAATGAGIALMIGAMLVIPIMDGAAKLLGSQMPVWQIVWARFFFHSLAMLPLFLWRHRWRELGEGRPVLQVVRAAVLVAPTALYFAAISRMPMADALAIYFIYPCIVTALAPWLLGERVGIWRWTATAIGLAGALIVIQPGAGIISAGAVSHSM
jgi:drug/metabolite transporter (DMT)-like permease